MADSTGDAEFVSDIMAEIDAEYAAKGFPLLFGPTREKVIVRALLMARMGEQNRKTIKAYALNE
jgi:hypothetical protein